MWKKEEGIFATMRGLMSILFLLIHGAMYCQGTEQADKVRKLLDRDKAYPALRKVDHYLLKRPDDAQLLLLRGETRNHIGEYAMAKQDIDRSLRLDPSLKGARMQLGLAHYGMGNADSAVIILQQVPQNRTRDIALARAFALDQQCTQAVELFNALLAQEEDARLYRDRGGCLVLLGDTAKAWTDLDRSIALAPRDPVAWNARGLLRHSAQGHYAKAIEDHKQAIKLDPNYSYAINNRGAAWMELGEYGKAHRDFMLAGRKNKRNPYVDFNKGLLALKEGRISDACGHFQESQRKGGTPQFGDRLDELIKEHCKERPVLVPRGTKEKQVPKGTNEQQRPRGNAPGGNAP